MIKTITQEELKKYLHYDPLTGVFTRLIGRTYKSSKGSVAGSKRSSGYVVVKLHNKPYLAHRLAFLYMTGSWPLNQVDHINGIRDDNKWINLRDVTQLENSKNSSKPCTNVSGQVGVYWDNQKSRWKCHITVNQKSIHLGYSDNKLDALALRKSAELKYSFHLNHGRSS